MGGLNRAGGGANCTASDLPELQMQMLIVFTGKTLMWRLGEIVKPIATRKWREFKHTKAIMGTHAATYTLDNLVRVISEASPFFLR